MCPTPSTHVCAPAPFSSFACFQHDAGFPMSSVHIYHESPPLISKALKREIYLLVSRISQAVQVVAPNLPFHYRAIEDPSGTIDILDADVMEGSTPTIAPFNLSTALLTTISSAVGTLHLQESRYTLGNIVKFDLSLFLSLLSIFTVAVNQMMWFWVLGSGFCGTLDIAMTE